MPERKPICWGPPDCERIIHEDMDEAIEAILDAWDGPLTGMVTVCGYARMEITKNDLDPERILEDVLERLDEEYGNPEEQTEPTLAMIRAAEMFAAGIKAEYVPWMCEEVERREIDVAAWVREHRPDWQEGTDGGHNLS